jgi:hypothetical protein
MGCIQWRVFLHPASRQCNRNVKYSNCLSAAHHGLQPPPQNLPQPCLLRPLESEAVSVDNNVMAARSMFIILSLLALSAAAQPPALADQHGKSASLDDYSGQPLVAIIASGRKLRQIKGWEEGLRKDYPQLVSVRVADITDEPRPTYDQVAEKLRKRAPEDVSIIIDLENQWATEYALDTREPCLLLFDEHGNLMAQFRGRANKTRLAEVSAALARVVPDTVASTDITP